MSSVFCVKFTEGQVLRIMMYETIKKLSKKSGISINKLELELGFSKGSLCRIDVNKPSADKLQKIADYFGVNLDYLMTGKKTKENSNSAKLADNNDITSELSSLRSKLEKEVLLYNGKPLDKKRRAALISVLELAIEDAKKE